MTRATLCLPVLMLLTACEGASPDPTADPPAVQREPVVPAGLVEVTVGTLGDDGCARFITVQWPEVYWSEQVYGLCNELDQVQFFNREGVCYSLGGSCPDWKDDPLVEVVDHCSSDVACPYSE